MEIERRRAFIINFIYVLILGVIVFVLLKYALPLLAPFVLGFFFAYILRRPIRFLSRRLNLPHKLAAVLVVAVFYTVIGLLLSLLGIRAASTIQSFVQILPHLYANHIEPLLTDIFTRIERLALQMEMDASLFALISELDTQLVQSLGNMVSSLSVRAMGAVSGIAAGLPAFFIKLLLMVICTFFIAADYQQLTRFCMNQLTGKAKTVFLQVKNYLIGTLFVCIRSYLLIMSITFAELSVGLSLIGIKHAVLIAALTSIFDILPVLGTGGIMIPWAVIAALSGRYSLGLKLFVIYLIITVIRNILEPKIVGGQLGLHPVVTLASMFAGVQLFGVIGLFGFPIGLSLLRYLNDNSTIRIFRSPGAENAP